MSAKLDNSKAMMALGRIHEQGIGVKKDLPKALAYY
jgi:TPR repeat protein